MIRKACSGYSGKVFADGSSDARQCNRESRLMSDLFTRPDATDLPSLSDPMHRRLDSTHMPAVDVYEFKGCFKVVMEAPGVHRHDIRVGMLDDTLIITATRHCRDPRSGAVPHRVERHCGHLSRRIALPCTPDPGSIHWDLHQGLLKISIRSCKNVR